MESPLITLQIPNRRRIGRIAQCCALVVSAAALGLSPALASASTATTNADALPGTVASVSCGDDVTASAITPAHGFDPLTATSAELAANNLPPRPTDGSAAELATWTKFVTTYKPKPACATATSTSPAAQGGVDDHLAVKPAVGAQRESDSANWSGNIADDATYDSASATWILPRPKGPSSGNAYSSQWVGIGQGRSSKYPLVQAGTEADSDDGGRLGTYYMWWEVVWPGGLPQKTIPEQVGPGNTIWVRIQVPAKCGYPTMTIENENTVQGYSETYKHTSCPDGTAEWIYERTEIGNNFPRLADAGVKFTSAEAASTKKGLTGIGNLPRYYSNMYNCTSAPDRELAAPGSITDNGTVFTAAWKNYGNQSPAKTCSAW